MRSRQVGPRAGRPPKRTQAQQRCAEITRPEGDLVLVTITFQLMTTPATLVVQREVVGLTDHLRSYKVVLDGSVVSRLRPGESCTLDVSPGTHELFLKIDWGRSKKVNVNLESGQTTQFLCAPRGNVATGLYWATIGSQRSIALTEVN